ncbi:MAG: 4Fe-4S binding protein [Anaerolineaceae bacterium]|nr:4Fe-4S binding protein [Anaerolineaceae bacterium]
MSAPADMNTLSAMVKGTPGGEHLLMCYSCGTCVSKCMIQEKLAPNYNPRRLIREAAFDDKELAFKDVTTWLCTACDLCYPACPQKIHISGVINAVKQAALNAGMKNPGSTAVADAQTCIACGLCVEVCPYEAIQIKVQRVPNRGLVPVAEVDSGKCMACGLCSAACKSTSIRQTNEYTDQSLMEGLWGFLNENGGQA